MRAVVVAAAVLALVAIVLPSVCSETVLYPAKIRFENEDRSFVEAEIIDREEEQKSHFRGLASHNVDRSLSETSASASLAPVGGACTASAGTGICQDVTTCTKSGGQSYAGLCQGNASIKCCVAAASHAAATPAAAPAAAANGLTGPSCKNGAGTCGPVSVCNSLRGQTFAGLCPGNASIKCCVLPSAASHATAPAAAPAAPAASSSVSACTYGGQLGQCTSSKTTCGGTRIKGLCYGSADVTCCLPGKNGKVISQTTSVVGGSRPRITQTTLQRLSETEHRKKWVAFKALRSPVYKTAAEEEAAYRIFRANRVRVIYLNDRYGKGYVIFSSRSPFATVPSGEFNQRLGALPVNVAQQNLFEQGAPVRSFLEAATEVEGERQDSSAFRTDDPHWTTFQQLADQVASNESMTHDDTAFIESVHGVEADATQDPVPDPLADPSAPAPDAPPAAAAASNIQWVVDYRNIMLPVRQQWSCGSCWAHATGGAIEGAMKRAGLNQVSIAPEWFLDCDKTGKQKRCVGGYHEIALLSAESYTPATEDEYPYRPFDTNGCKMDNGHSGARVAGYQYVAQCTTLTCDNPNEAALLAALKTSGPIPVVVDAANWQMYEGGIFPNEGCTHSRMNMNHAVVVVGYGTENGKAFWLIRNSYSDGYGEQGHIRLEANVGGACGVVNRAVKVQVKKA